MTVINAQGRQFNCSIVPPVPDGFTVAEDPGMESCVLSHAGLDYEVVSSVSMRIRVGIAGQKWSSVANAGYHPETSVRSSSSSSGMYYTHLESCLFYSQKLLHLMSTVNRTTIFVLQSRLFVFYSVVVHFCCD